MSISFHRDGSARRILATISPGERFGNFERDVGASLERHPEQADWDLIIDDRGPLEDITVAGMARIAEMYRSRSTGGHPRTVVITTDR
jgi:hypothetical protein